MIIFWDPHSSARTTQAGGEVSLRSHDYRQLAFQVDLNYHNLGTIFAGRHPCHGNLGYVPDPQPSFVKGSFRRGVCTGLLSRRSLPRSQWRYFQAIHQVCEVTVKATTGNFAPQMVLSRSSGPKGRKNIRIPPTRISAIPCSWACLTTNRDPYVYVVFRDPR